MMVLLLKTQGIDANDHEIAEVIDQIYQFDDGAPAQDTGTDPTT
jgi:hypothetical protein